MNSELNASIRTVLETDPDYPETLRELTDSPPVLFIKGRWPLPDKRLIAIVGTRHPTAYGLEVAARWTSRLVGCGYATVSGLATGIDACAHQTTLDLGGWTIAVLGHGFKYQYPKSNAGLFARIETQGTLITEFPFETKPDAAHFPRRNRIVSGLSQGVLVVEAAHRSGASITAHCAAEQGRDVFVVPGSVLNPQSVGCHRLIKEGARLTQSVEEILEEYGEFVVPSPSAGRLDSQLDVDLAPREKQVLKSISATPLSIDELVELSGFPVEQLAEVLLSLELKGRIKSLPGQQYAA